MCSCQWRRQDLLLEGETGLGSGAEPQKIFSLTTPSTLAVNDTNTPFLWIEVNDTVK